MDPFKLKFARYVRDAEDEGGERFLLDPGHRPYLTLFGGEDDAEEDERHAPPPVVVHGLDAPRVRALQRVKYIVRHEAWARTRLAGVPKAWLTYYEDVAQRLNSFERVLRSLRYHMHNHGGRYLRQLAQSRIVGVGGAGDRERAGLGPDELVSERTLPRDVFKRVRKLRLIPAEVTAVYTELDRFERLGPLIMARCAATQAVLDYWRGRIEAAATAAKSGSAIRPKKNATEIAINFKKLTAVDKYGTFQEMLARADEPNEAAGKRLQQAVRKEVEHRRDRVLEGGAVSEEEALQEGVEYHTQHYYHHHLIFPFEEMDAALGNLPHVPVRTPEMEDEPTIGYDDDDDSRSSSSADGDDADDAASRKHGRSDDGEESDSNSDAPSRKKARFSATGMRVALAAGAADEYRRPALAFLQGLDATGLAHLNVFCVHVGTTILDGEDETPSPHRLLAAILTLNEKQWKRVLHTVV